MTDATSTAKVLNNVATQTTLNAPTIVYTGNNGQFYLPSTIPSVTTLDVTNIPVTAANSYTFIVSYWQPTTSYYIRFIQFKDANNGYITNGGLAGYSPPLFAGGAPTLNVTSGCVINQSFTVIQVGGTRRVTSTVSCCY